MDPRKQCFLPVTLVQFDTCRGRQGGAGGSGRGAVHQRLLQGHQGPEGRHHGLLQPAEGQGGAGGGVSSYHVNLLSCIDLQGYVP